MANRFSRSRRTQSPKVTPARMPGPIVWRTRSRHAIWAPASVPRTMSVGSQKRRHSFVPWRAVAASGRSAASRTIGPKPTTGMVVYCIAPGSL